MYLGLGNTVTKQQPVSAVASSLSLDFSAAANSQYVYLLLDDWVM